MFKEIEELKQIQLDEKTSHGEISSMVAAVRNLGTKIAKLDQERQRQQELLYAVDFQCQLMQRKVARVSGGGQTVGNEEILGTTMTICRRRSIMHEKMGSALLRPCVK